MKLSQSLEGKKIKIVTVDGEEFVGIVSDYIYPEDNEPEGCSAIAVENCLQRPGQWIGFNDYEIASISIID